MPRQIYFAGSITGGRDDAALYGQIVDILRAYGRVISEHVGSPDLDLFGEVELDDRFVHDRDLEWLQQSDAVVAEVTQPSIGTGYEIGRAVTMGKATLCLYRDLPGRRITRMLSGNSDVVVRVYDNVNDLQAIFDEFFNAPSSQ